MAFAPRLKKLSTALARLDAASAVVLFSTPPSRRNNDVPHNFRQLSNFLYLTGSSIQDCALIVFPDREKSVLLQRERTKLESLWDGDVSGGAHLAGDLGIGFQTVPNIQTEVLRLLQGVERAYIDEENQLPNKGIVTALLFPSSLSRKSPYPTQIHSVRELLAPMRFVKSRDEVRAIKHAIAITSTVYKEFTGQVRPGITELELARFVEGTALLYGARPSFQTIVASGSSASTLHHSPSQKKLARRDWLLIDFGFETSGYGSDITRCLPVSPEHYSEEGALLYEIVSDCLRRSRAKVKPGIPVKKIYEYAASELTYGLIELGVLRGKHSNLVTKKAFQPYFPHGIGHSLGLDVHDIATEPLVLKQGAVLTIEPGLYFHPKMIEHKGAERFRGLGIRLEDDVLVTKSGHENLSEAIELL